MARCSVKPVFNGAVAIGHSNINQERTIQALPSMSRILLLPFSTNPISLGDCGPAFREADRGMSKCGVILVR
jgi:hypothetical protein